MSKIFLFISIMVVSAVLSGCLSGSKEVPVDEILKEVPIETDSGVSDMGDQSAPMGGLGPAVFKDYEYPGSTFDGSFQQGEMLSASYITTDDIDKIVTYYTQRLGVEPLIAGSLIQFEIFDSNNHRITIGVISRGDDNQINLTDWGVQQ